MLNNFNSLLKTNFFRFSGIKFKKTGIRKKRNPAHNLKRQTSNNIFPEICTNRSIFRKYFIHFFVTVQSPPSSGRYGLYLPTVIDDGPANRYAAGTFQYEVATPVPVPATMLLLGTSLAGLVSTRIKRKKNKKIFTAGQTNGNYCPKVS
ncbi:MAG: PEP-CTERM sorting domain-containing protein [Desulfobulbaceae bacterium]|nr:PEP-CTERM sorting domain-containing protein [Desulfobulbaceae bacterium]